MCTYLLSKIEVYFLISAPIELTVLNQDIKLTMITQSDTYSNIISNYKWHGMIKHRLLFYGVIYQYLPNTPKMFIHFETHISQFLEQTTKHFNPYTRKLTCFSGSVRMFGGPDDDISDGADKSHLRWILEFASFAAFCTVYQSLELTTSGRLCGHL